MNITVRTGLEFIAIVILVAAAWSYVTQSNQLENARSDLSYMEQRGTQVSRNHAATATNAQNQIQEIRQDATQAVDAVSQELINAQENATIQAEAFSTERVRAVATQSMMSTEAAAIEEDLSYVQDTLEVSIADNAELVATSEMYMNEIYAIETEQASLRATATQSANDFATLDASSHSMQTQAVQREEEYAGTATAYHQQNSTAEAHITQQANQIATQSAEIDELWEVAQLVPTSTYAADAAEIDTEEWVQYRSPEYTLLLPPSYIASLVLPDNTDFLAELREVSTEHTIIAQRLNNSIERYDFIAIGRDMNLDSSTNDYFIIRDDTHPNLSLVAYGLETYQSVPDNMEIIAQDLIMIGSRQILRTKTLAQTSQYDQIIVHYIFRENEIFWLLTFDTTPDLLEHVEATFERIVMDFTLVQAGDA